MEGMICTGDEMEDVIPDKDICSVVVAGGFPPEREMVMDGGGLAGSNEADIFFILCFRDCWVFRESCRGKWQSISTLSSLGAQGSSTETQAMRVQLTLRSVHLLQCGMFLQ